MHTLTRETATPRILLFVAAAAALTLAACDVAVPTPFGSMPAAQGVATDCAAAAAAIAVVQSDAQITGAGKTASDATTAQTLLTTDCAAVQAGLKASQAAASPSAYVAAETNLAEARRKLTLDARAIEALPNIGLPKIRW